MIALLIGLMVPALARARQSAGGAVCASNLRQLALANDLYAADFSDRLAPGAPDVLKNLTRWHGARPSSASEFAPPGGTLTRYISGDSSDRGSSSAVRACPAFARAAARLREARTGFERSAGGYVYNNAFAGTDRRCAGREPAGGREVWETATDLAGAPRSRFATPARTLAFADGAFADGNTIEGVIEFSFAEPRFWPQNPVFRADPSIHFRHAGGAKALAATNIAWLDGHVRTERMAFTWSSGFYPGTPAAHNIGWPGDADDNSLFEYR